MVIRQSQANKPYSAQFYTQLTEPLNLVGRGQSDPSVHNPAASLPHHELPSKVKLAEDYFTLLMVGNIQIIPKTNTEQSYKILWANGFAI